MQCLSQSFARTSFRPYGYELLHCRPSTSARLGCPAHGSRPRHVAPPKATDERTESTPASPPSAPSLVDTQAPETQTPADVIPVIPVTSPLPFQLIQIFAGLGVAETLYLTVVKYTGSQVLCPTSGCASVLASPYASLYGLPLPVLGVLAYAITALLATNAVNARPPATTTATLLLASSTALLTTSASLMYVLFDKLGGLPCTWCFASALLSLAIFTTSAAFALTPAQSQQAAAPAAAAAAATAVVLWGGWKDIETFVPDFFLPYTVYEITQPSPPGAVDLARRLKAAGARMYGAFWCSHCQEQKQAFGAEAMAEFPYQECYPNGWEMGAPLAPACQAVNLQGFPTWVIGDQVYEGEQSFQQLEAALAKAQAATQ